MTYIFTVLIIMTQNYEYFLGGLSSIFRQFILLIIVFSKLILIIFE